jgi:hypothetical protein
VIARDRVIGNGKNLPLIYTDNADRKKPAGPNDLGEQNEN